MVKQVLAVIAIAVVGFFTVVGLLYLLNSILLGQAN
jgi:hypothetical protein